MKTAFQALAALRALATSAEVSSLGSPATQPLSSYLRQLDLSNKSAGQNDSEVA